MTFLKMKKTSYIQIGEFTSTYPNKKPTPEGVAYWWNDFKKTPHLDDYEVYICGAVLEGIDNTWDLDVVITGDIKYHNELKFILDEGIRIGLKYWMLVDIVWTSRIIDSINEGFKPHTAIRSFNKSKMFRDKELSYDKISKEIYPGLYQRELLKENKSFKKHYQRIKDGKYTLGIQKVSEYIYNNKHRIPAWLHNQQ